MHRIIIVAVLLLGLTGCDALDSLVNGFKESREVASDLEQTVGMKPEVSFRWANGRLLFVEVTFPHLDDSKTLRDWDAIVRVAVANHFKQKPQNIVLGFTLNQ